METTSKSNTNLTTTFSEDRQWAAKLNLSFVDSDNKTVLKKMLFEGPLRVQRVFYPEDDYQNKSASRPCHCYLLHPPGGLVSGDRLLFDIEAKQKSHVLLTTPSATKVYMADSLDVPQHQSCKLKLENSFMEYLPLETIIFDKANCNLDLEVDADSKSSFIGIEILCLGRKFCEEFFSKGRLLQKTVIKRDNKPVLFEKLRLTKESTLLDKSYGLDGVLTLGTLYAMVEDSKEEDLAATCEELKNCFETTITFDKDDEGPIDTNFLNSVNETTLLKSLENKSDDEIKQALLPHDKSCRFAITMRNHILIVRYLGNDNNECKRLLIYIWSKIRFNVFGLKASVPRIWNT